eukprot:SAG22_NODE_44_length_24912_cov_33.648894_13_plen_39_part_00
MVALVDVPGLLVVCYACTMYQTASHPYAKHVLGIRLYC